MIWEVLTTMVTYAEIDELYKDQMVQFKQYSEGVKNVPTCVLNLNSFCRFLGFGIVHESGNVRTRIVKQDGYGLIYVANSLASRDVRVELARMASLCMLHLVDRSGNYEVTGHEPYCVLALQLYLMDKILVPESEWYRIDFQSDDWFSKLVETFQIPLTYGEDWVRRNCRPVC